MNPQTLELFVCKGLGYLVVFDLYSIQEGQYLAESCLSVFEAINPWRALWIHPYLAHSCDSIADSRSFDANDGVERESRMFVVWKWYFDAPVEDDVTHRSVRPTAIRNSVVLEDETRIMSRL